MKKKKEGKKKVVGGGVGMKKKERRSREKAKKKKKTLNQKKIQPSATSTKRKNFQSSIPPITTQTHLHHNPSFKSQLQTQKTQTHQHKIFRSVIQNCQLKHINTENPNPNPGILRLKTKIMKKRSGFLFLGIYLSWMNMVSGSEEERKKE